jgi:hypothetical protein
MVGYLELATNPIPAFQSPEANVADVYRADGFRAVLEEITTWKPVSVLRAEADGGETHED